MRDVLAAVAIALAGAGGIAVVQPDLASAVKKVHAGDDSTALPPPKQLRVLAAGYRQAAADLLWASLVVQHGIHSQEHRAFHGITRYLDGILELDPAHPIVYSYVDTLIIYAPGQTATEEDARTARAYLERGTRERPYDPDIWLHYGQYLAFLAPAYLKDEAEIDRWRTDGALAVSHAIELGADARHGLSAATILNKANQKEASIKNLQRMYALTDDPDTRLQIIYKLNREQASLQVESTVGAVEHEWRSRYPFLSRGEALLIGPSRKTASCAGRDARSSRACPADWSAATAD